LLHNSVHYIEEINNPIDYQWLSITQEDFDQFHINHNYSQRFGTLSNLTSTLVLAVNQQLHLQLLHHRHWQVTTIKHDYDSIWQRMLVLIRMLCDNKQGIEGWSGLHFDVCCKILREINLFCVNGYCEQIFLIRFSILYSFPQSIVNLKISPSIALMLLEKQWLSWKGNQLCVCNPTKS
jgi:hypothetical protein